MPQQKRFEDNIAWWEAQLAQVTRDRAQLPWIPGVGLPVAAAVAFFGRPLWGAGCLAITLVTWLTGIYLVTVRAYEYRHNRAQAQEELDRLQAAPPP